LMASRIVIPPSDQLLAFLNDHVARPSMTEHELFLWRAKQAPYPQSLNDCLLHLPDAPATPGTGHTFWKILRTPGYYWGPNAWLDFKTDYVVTFAEYGHTFQLRLSSPRWLLEVSGYVIGSRCRRRWICSTCGRNNAFVFVRVRDGHALCY